MPGSITFQMLDKPYSWLPPIEDALQVAAEERAVVSRSMKGVASAMPKASKPVAGALSEATPPVMIPKNGSPRRAWQPFRSIPFHLRHIESHPSRSRDEALPLT